MRSTSPAPGGEGARRGLSSASGKLPLEEDLLIEEIAALDIAFEKGLISEATYSRLRAARKSELVQMRLRRLGVRQG